MARVRRYCRGRSMAEFPVRRASISIRGRHYGVVKGEEWNIRLDMYSAPAWRMAASTTVGSCLTVLIENRGLQLGSMRGQAGRGREIQSVDISHYWRTGPNGISIGFLVTSNKMADQLKRHNLSYNDCYFEFIDIFYNYYERKYGQSPEMSIKLVRSPCINFLKLPRYHK